MHMYQANDVDECSYLPGVVYVTNWITEMTLFSTRLFQCRQFPAALIAHRQGRGERSGRVSGEVPSSNNCAMRRPCLLSAFTAVDLLSREVDTLNPHPQVKRELRETKMELQDAKGKLSQASGEANRVAIEFPQQIDHVKSCTNYDPPYGGPGVQYVRFIARFKALFIARFTCLELDS